MENGLTVEDTEVDGLLAVGDLVRMFEDSEEATQEARQTAERDRDYYDNKQLTADEMAALKKRGQPPVIANRIKRKVDFLVGLEKQQRVDPKALPRTPMHDEDAAGATQALRFVAESEDYDSKRSAVWRNMLIEGAGGIAVAVEPARVDRQQMMASTMLTPMPEYVIRLRRVAWDRMFWDPHSAEADFSDAGYLGVVLWMDHDEALARYRDNPEAADILETTMQSVGYADTYDDKPKYQLWADPKRKRVRIVQMWIKRDEEWFFAEFSRGGILKAGPSPYRTDTGESDCELIFQSSFVDRDNNRYGAVREMISPQDEINKRRSKALHLLNTAQIVTEEGAVNDIEKTRREAARPDGVILVNPGFGDRFKFETRTDLATGHFQLLQEAKGEIDLMGPNASMLGEDGDGTASGKAIIASQQGGMVQMGDLLDNLRHLDRRVFRAVWNRIRQFWTTEKWIRVTDDERNVKWLGMNVDPMAVQMQMQQDPAMGARIAGVVQSVAELDCDIIIDEAPDSVTPALEQWQELAGLAKAGVPIPPDILVEAAPNLKNKDRILERMKEAAAADPAAEMRTELEMRNAQAVIADKEASAAGKQANALKTMQEIQMRPVEMAQRAQTEQARLMRPQGPPRAA